ncbi:MAG: isoleucine--tRNA ligase [Clostridia bacterium]|nr:isoleucine--tRNA ligase [Clostridia bacterium]
MYKKVDTSLDFAKRELDILDYWQKNDIINQSLHLNEGKESFTFYDGPPTANGKPHIGHVLTRAMKDLIPRYRVMKGYSVLRKAGWDTHGLPVELEVEKHLGLDGKQDIEKYGIEPFIQKCKESVWLYKKEWEQLSHRVAFWVDMDNPYITYDNNYIESLWWALKTIFDKGLIYKGHKIVPYCPRCGTALSSHEVAQGYKDVKESSVVVRFPVEGKQNTYFLAWTTTPWTLPSNVALCVNRKQLYSTVKCGNDYYILAKELISAHFSEGSYEIVDTVEGRALEYAKYVPLFPYQQEKAYYVTCDNYVTLTDGTGIVHIAPAFGEDDSNVGRKYNLPFVQMVNDRGNFVEQAGSIAGMFCKDADKVIISDLMNRGLLYKELLYEHSYPFCWRCDTPLLYYARKSWFIKMTAVKEQLVANNRSVNWIPDNIKEGRMGNFVGNVIDWGISRERYWGTPLPFWVCNKCGKIHAVGSIEELHQLSGCDKNIELHRPFIDEVTFPCQCGGVYKRTPEVIDCWFDSGSMPYAQWHYPFENKELFEKNFPAQFISEATDQTRGWFYTLLAVSTLLFGKSSFENCLVLGLVGDKDGIKMSKHLGNVVSPWDPLGKQGADAVRWYFYTGSQPWLPTRFYDEAVSEGQRKFMGTLWNTYAFFVLYADIDKFNPASYQLEDCKLSVMDRWILSKLNTLIDYVDNGLDRYEVTETAREIERFVDLLSNWYVRRCRERYWGSQWTDDKQSAYVVLYNVLLTLTKLCAPFVPFISEEMYLNLVPNFYKDAPKSVHLTSYPVCNNQYVDKQLEIGMDAVLDIVALGRNCRNASNIKNRQPLSKMYVVSKVELSDELKDVVCDELNIKNILPSYQANAFVSYQLKPQLKTLGPKYGKILNCIRTYLLTTTDAKRIVDTVNNGDTYSVEIAGVQVELTQQDLLITTMGKEGYSVASQLETTVALDTTLTQELIEEGLLRELVSKIQSMRKECDYNVIDHINLSVEGGKEVLNVLNKYQQEIKRDTLTDNIVDNNGTSKEWDINGHNVVITMCVNK